MTENLRNTGRIEGCGQLDVQPGKLRNKGGLDPKKILLNEGGMDPASLPLEPVGGLSLLGDYVEESDASISIDIASPGPAGMTYDRIDVSGEGTLAGQLEVRLVGGCPLPAPTDSFEVFRADGGRTGLFSNASTIVDAGAGTFDVVYTATSVWLTNFQPSTAVEPMSWGEVKVRFR